MITTFIATRMVEITCSTIFIAGIVVYGYIKNKGNTKHKLVYYNLSDRIVKGKKIQQKISDRVGGSGKNDTFFKAS